MSFLNSLEMLLGMHRQQPHPQQPQAPAPQQSAPDITYNPNPNTNIPYSAHSPALARMGNQYTANPTAPQFRGVDPAQFGYPQDLIFRQPDSTPRYLQAPSYNNGQVSLNGRFMQGGLSAPEYTQSPYADLNQRILY